MPPENCLEGIEPRERDSETGREGNPGVKHKYREPFLYCPSSLYSSLPPSLLCGDVVLLEINAALELGCYKHTRYLLDVACTYSTVLCVLQLSNKVTLD